MDTFGIPVWSEPKPISKPRPDDVLDDDDDAPDAARDIRPSTQKRIDQAYAAPIMLPFQQQRVDSIRKDIHALSLRLAAHMPEGRELNTALKNLEQAFFWASAGIARRPRIQESPHDPLHAGP